jgi:hypothetical protein
LSLFLPHPNAPKPTTSSFGPMYARRSPPQQYQYPGSSASATNSAVNVIHMAVTSQYGPNSMVRPTIYGQCDFDLMTSMGPVPISFSLDPPKSIRVPQSAPRPSVTTSTISPRDTSGSNVTEWPASVDNSTDRSPTPSSPIPRANFFPKAQTTRPRSRSFSEFNKSSTGNSLALERRSVLACRRRLVYSTSASLEEGSKPRTASISKAPLARAASASVTVLSSQNSLILQTPNVSSRQLRASSPLSLSQNNNAAVLRTGKSPTNLYPLPPSPLSQDARAFSDTNDAASSSPTIVDPRLSKPPPEGINCTTPPPIQRYFPSSDSRASLSNFRGDTRDPSLKELRPRRSVDGNLSHLNDIRSQVSTPLSTIPLVRNTSLRSKMSLPTLRGRAGFKNSKDDSSSIVSSPQVIEPGPDNETMQVQDMDFELIRPVISHVSESSSTQPSGDSGLLSHSASPEIKLEFSAGLLRADSPTVSMLSGLASGERSPTTLDDASRPRTPKPFELESSIDAHRQRELRWVSLMSSIPPAQIRKNKRVKKLLVEGVPSSVRYLVWAHLTNSKSRGVTGVYSQLGKRGKVPASGEIERDVQQCFLDQPQLRSTDGPLCSLLQAYLTMVPDIRYHIGVVTVL